MELDVDELRLTVNKTNGKVLISKPIRSFSDDEVHEVNRALSTKENRKGLIGWAVQLIHEANNKLNNPLGELGDRHN